MKSPIVKLAAALMGLTLCSWAWADGPTDGPATWEQVISQPAGAADNVVAYGEHPDQFGELRLPEKPGPHPVVVLIHGGCWLPDFDLTHVRPLAEAITGLGWATWTIEYRRPSEGEDLWPATFNDVATALDKLPDLADSYHLDLGQIIVLGHSAGGQLALWLAARPGFDSDHPLNSSNPLRVQRVIALAPITDMAGYAEGERGCPLGARRVMGGGPEERAERYRAVSPQENPAPAIRTDLVHAIEDRIVPLDQSIRFSALIRELGGAATLHRLPPPAGHFDVLVTEGAAWSLIADLLTD